jgi:guanyl-specific ribonuclease Sa
MKNIKLSLVLAAAVISGGLSAVCSTPAVPAKDEGAKPVFETLTQFPGAQFNIDLPTPVLRADDPVIQSDTAKGGNANCTPSSAVAPGTDFSPKINDSIRTAAIIELLAKISACKPLPYSQDGVTNNNLEGGMPQAPAGYYKEYTLIVPGRKTGDGPEPINIGGRTYMSGAMLSKRGPERIIIGGCKSIYYTPDHYATFIELKIVE